MKQRPEIPVAFLAFLLAAAPLSAADEQARRPSPPPAAPTIFASPVHGGCYIAAPGQCRIHMEPFTIDIASGQKLVFFSLVAIRQGTGAQTTIYNFKPDVSNPVPYSGTLFTPSLVAMDYAATCGATYQVSLQGQDTGDTGAFNLGQTGSFTCPSTLP
jgi:hypothetical protein